MNLKYYLYSFCNGELMYNEEFNTKEELKKYLKNNKYLEDVEIIHGWRVS